jgi:hypothetical protein
MSSAFILIAYAKYGISSLSISPMIEDAELITSGISIVIVAIISQKIFFRFENI